MAGEYSPTCASCVKPVLDDAVYYDARLWHRECLDARRPGMKARRQRERQVMLDLGMISDPERSKRRAR